MTLRTKYVVTCILELPDQKINHTLTVLMATSEAEAKGSAIDEMMKANKGARLSSCLAWKVE